MEKGCNHSHKPSLGQKMADKVASLVGSWKFIFFQSSFFLFWIILNTSGILSWDSHPFIFLTLLLGIQAAYTAPIILMSQNRTEERDRRKAEMDFLMDKKAEREIEDIQAQLDRMEKKIDRLSGNSKESK
jgi:uncharacterized membrane protein